jgi:hypothetical protein
VLSAAVAIESDTSLAEMLALSEALALRDAAVL